MSPLWVDLLCIFLQWSQPTLDCLLSARLLFLLTCLVILALCADLSLLRMS